MNALTRVDTFNDLLPDMLRRFSRPFGLAEHLPPEIKLDVTEHDADYAVRAEIPGARKEDISVTIDGSFVSIVAELRSESEQARHGRVMLKESSLGRVSRGFSLAHEIDAGGVVARLEDGVLRLTLPKRESSRSRTIQVQ
ncbi:MAG: Hsp20/alpha crystallin family protein [Aquincola tertiaricarbonis]|uniref:Hsp20/alpha crystallin family protein n=1 Tax=Aquincola TaxID=391952 RepID=UPI000615036A|nr:MULTISPECIES: Hsp20/alpha crystallin family protein [Aquincola]MCR5867979.1 Hsp20/alpha crystallin family protein [Aquincola sp. J276]